MLTLHCFCVSLFFDPIILLLKKANIVQGKFNTIELLLLEHLTGADLVHIKEGLVYKIKEACKLLGRNTNIGQRK